MGKTNTRTIEEDREYLSELKNIKTLQKSLFESIDRRINKEITRIKNRLEGSNAKRSST